MKLIRFVLGWFVYQTHATSTFKPKDQLTLCSIDYQVVGKIGKGGFSTVYKAIELENNGFVALKQVIASPTTQRQIHQESNVFRLMKGYENLLQMHCAAHFLDQTVFVMEYCDTDLFDYKHAAGQNLGEDEVRPLLLQLAYGIQALRQFNIIHRDLKLENLLLTSNYQTLKIADFGLSIFKDQLPCRYGGTKQYMPPEVLLGLSYDESVDLWAVGVILHQLLVGFCPYTVNIDTLKRISRRKHLQLARIEGVSMDMYDLINGLLQPPNHRMAFHEFMTRAEAMNGVTTPEIVLLENASNLDSIHSQYEYSEATSTDNRGCIHCVLQ